MTFESELTTEKYKCKAEKLKQLTATVSVFVSLWIPKKKENKNNGTREDSV